MQAGTFDLTAEAHLSNKPSLELFEQGLRNRLEAFTLGVDASLDCYQNQDMTGMIDYLELTLPELRFLLNDFRLLEQLQAITQYFGVPAYRFWRREIYKQVEC